ncbi:MAG: DUF2336 domain-containing protein [Hyphomicrobiales bacterium]
MVDEDTKISQLAVLRAAVEDHSTAKRIEALAGLTLLRKTSGAEPHLLKEIDIVLNKLAIDQEMTVRHGLAQELVGESNVSADVVFAVVADFDEVALPFLAKTRSLNSRMITVIARVGDEARKATVAKRPDITEEIISVILKEGGVEATIALLSNENLNLSPRHYETILGAFGDERSVLDCMVRRTDLPAYLKVMMAKQVSQEMRRKIKNTDQNVAQASEKKIIKAEEIALLRIASGTKPRELEHLVHYLVERGQLTPSILLRAACTGEMDFVVEALALLSSMPAERVRTLIYAKGALSLRAVHSKAALPKALFVPLRVAVDVENTRKQENAPKSADVFGRKMVECALTHYENLSDEQRNELLGMIGSYGAPGAAALAVEIMEGVARAA